MTSATTPRGNTRLEGCRTALAKDDLWVLPLGVV